MSRGRSRSRRPNIVSWLGPFENDPSGEITNGGGVSRVSLYDAATSGGDLDELDPDEWLVERMVGELSVLPTGTAAQKLIKICFGVGMVGSAGAADRGTIGDLAAPAARPDASWMVYLCCYVNLGALEVERCTFDIRPRRIIDRETVIGMAISESTPHVDTIAAGEAVHWSLHMRTLIRQRG